MSDAAWTAVLDRFPESRALIIRLLGRSAQFRALCEDFQAVAAHVASLEHTEDRREHERLLAELELEIAEWIGSDHPPSRRT